MLHLTLAWRNIWRNRKRTTIAAASVFFAVLLAVVMRSAQNGSYAYMIDSSAKLFTGYLQVQGKGYWENRSLDKSIVLNRGRRKMITGIPAVTALAPRLEAFALASHGSTTKVAEIVGIDPGRETMMTDLKARVVDGHYLDAAGSQGALIAAGLAKALKLGIGDDLVLFGQGYHGQMAAAKIEVTGIAKLPFPDMNNGLIYLTLERARDIFSAPGRITSAALMIDNLRDLPGVRHRLQRQLGPGYIIMTWKEMMPDLVQSIALDNSSGMVMIGILYMVIAFGIFGTVMMMTSERGKEFRILLAVGMSKARLMGVTSLETVFISLLGVAAGIFGSLPIVYYLHIHPLHMHGDAAKAFLAVGVEPIMNFSTDSRIFGYQALVVLLISLATAVYPVLFIGRLRPVQTSHN